MGWCNQSQRQGRTIEDDSLRALFSLFSSDGSGEKGEGAGGGHEDDATQNDAAVRCLGEEGISGELPDVEWGEPVSDDDGVIWADDGEAATAIEGSHHDAVFE